MYYTLLALDSSLTYFEKIDKATILLYSLQAIIDPVLFIFTLKDLRITVQRIIFRLSARRRSRVEASAKLFLTDNT